MNIDPQQVHTFEVSFDAGNQTPPPYHYAYHLQVNLAAAGTPVSFEIKYLHREALREDDIFDEGFTLEDDWEWKGNLPENWREAIKDQIQKQSWPKKPEKVSLNAPLLQICLLDANDKKLFEGPPSDLNSWEYFLQELSQALYEIGEKEAPFHLAFREISSGEKQLDIQIEASFARQTITAKKFVNGVESETTMPAWKELKHLMKLIYMPDYDYERARLNEPKKRGKYVFTGEGLWFKFGESLLEPSKKSTSLEQLERELKGLFL